MNCSVQRDNDNTTFHVAGPVSPKSILMKTNMIKGNALKQQGSYAPGIPKRLICCKFQTGVLWKEEVWFFSETLLVEHVPLCYQGKDFLKDSPNVKTFSPKTPGLKGGKKKKKSPSHGEYE